MENHDEAEEQQRMENNKVSVTSLTDDELKEFNEKIEHGKLLPIDKVIGEPDIFLKWVDENVNGIDKDEFFEFLIRHESEISAYARLKSSYPQLNTEEKDEICKFFVRWFLKEQAS